MPTNILGSAKGNCVKLCQNVSRKKQESVDVRGDYLPLVRKDDFGMGRNVIDKLPAKSRTLSMSEGAICLWLSKTISERGRNVTNFRFIVPEGTQNLLFSIAEECSGAATTPKVEFDENLHRGWTSVNPATKTLTTKHILRSTLMVIATRRRRLALSSKPLPWRPHKKGV